MKINFDKLNNLALGLLILSFLYLAISGIGFAFRNPNATPTQQLLHTKDVLLWHKLDKFQDESRIKN